MSVTINVNNISLVHKGSNGIAIATIPDVCKTPSPGGPVPIPYPNIARSGMLSKGSKKVKADGGNMIANKGSEFSMSNGDEAGVVGGVKSSTNMKEATWLLYSFDVKIEGKNACRLTDKMQMNHGNTVCLAGEMQLFLNVLETAGEEAALCVVICHCEEDPIISNAGYKLKERCVERTLKDMDKALDGKSPLKAEQGYDMWQSPPEPVPGRPTKPKGRYIYPDVVILKEPSKPAIQSNLKEVIEIKFPGDREGLGQMANQKEIAGDAPSRKIDVEAGDCGCKKPKSEPIRVPEFKPNPFWEILLFLAWLAASLLAKRPLPKLA